MKKLFFISTLLFSFLTQADSIVPISDDGPRAGVVDERDYYAHVDLSPYGEKCESLLPYRTEKRKQEVGYMAAVIERCVLDNKPEEFWRKDHNNDQRYMLAGNTVRCLFNRVGPMMKSKTDVDLSTDSGYMTNTSYIKLKNGVHNLKLMYKKDTSPCSVAESLSKAIYFEVRAKTEETDVINSKEM
jgi:hypothetical protein